MKYYLLICEIGPIYDFVRQSRKTVDFWGASFLFSYFMSEVARNITNNGGTIFLPHLDNNPMYAGSGTITCGSVPDQIYATFTASQGSDIENGLKTVLENVIKAIAPKVEAMAGQKGKRLEDLVHGEVKNFFQIFYIIHEINGIQPTFDEFVEAERKIRMRYAFRPFMQTTGSDSIAKWDKCSLCGDRKRIYSIVVDKDAGLYSEEHICSVCLLKRFLPESVKSIFSGAIEIKDPHYKSTSDIALSPIKECIDTADDEIKETYHTLIKACEQESEEKDSEGRFFYDPVLRKKFEEKFAVWEKKIREKYPEKIKLKWLNRPFYSIVYMDGDNMGDILKANRDKFPAYIKDVSKVISDFSNAVDSIVSKQHGQLIFAGGEDINFVIHPEYLLDCIKELNETYNKFFTENNHTEPMAEKFTLSAGVMICYHKYPLSEAIHRAGVMLKDHAKKRKGKDATAISLIKGHTEALQFTFSNKSLSNLKKLKECLMQSEISRTTPYRIAENKELFAFITDAALRENYLYTIIAGTRNPGKEKPDIKEIVRLLASFEDTETMIDALLFARFMSGDR